MIDTLRRFFGMNEATGKRTVAGRPDHIRNKDVPYIRDSNKRLAALDHLYSSYQKTTHAPKIKTVYDKTQRIHTYLVNRGRLHDLELFHVQHTDHFLNAFSVILEVHAQQHAPAAHKPTASEATPAGRRVEKRPLPQDAESIIEVRKHNQETTQQLMAETTQANTKVPILTVPEISINTYSTIFYLKEDSLGKFTKAAIGYTSSAEEKAAFQQHVATQFGLEPISYIGNALVYSQAQNQSAPSAALVPILHWNGCPYALVLEEGRLFPVRTFRKQH